MSLTVVTEPDFDKNKLAHKPDWPVPKFVPLEKWRTKNRFFIIDNVTWSSAGYIISVELLELSNRKIVSVKYPEMKQLVEERRMIEWKPE